MKHAVCSLGPLQLDYAAARNTGTMNDPIDVTESVNRFCHQVLHECKVARIATSEDYLGAGCLYLLNLSNARGRRALRLLFEQFSPVVSLRKSRAADQNDPRLHSVSEVRGKC